MSLESFLNPDQIETLKAMTECFLPSDSGPGAAEAGVIGYIEWLGGQRFFRRHQKLLSDGLDLLGSWALDHHGAAFAALPAARQNEVLEELGKIPHPLTQRFLIGVLRMTLAGYLCDPKYGGNRGRIGWRHVGFERRTAAGTQIEIEELTDESIQVAAGAAVRRADRR